jgi:hypothetical protein
MESQSCKVIQTLLAARRAHGSGLENLGDRDPEKFCGE